MAVFSMPLTSALSPTIEPGIKFGPIVGEREGMTLAEFQPVS